MNQLAPPFDALAARYDASFTDTELGRRYRNAVWRRFAACFPPGGRVLELNCGTGADAVELARRGVSVLATDIAPAMVERTAAKAAAAGLADRVTTRVLDVADLGQLVGEEPNFDGALSNFGGLNCVADLAAVAGDLAAVLRPGAKALVCLMGPYVPGEWLWFLAHGQPRKAARRLASPVLWHGVEIRYPSVGQAKRAFRPAFQVSRTWGLGGLLPPPAAESCATRQPRLVELLDTVERRFETFPLLARLADHYVLELVRL